MKMLTDVYKLSNGVGIPCVGYGTWQTPNGEVATAAVLEALKCGYRHIDTAFAYYNEVAGEELLRWITSYCKRYFSQQFKRSCLMDGPAVEHFTVSPRVGHLIPSDAENTMFLRNIGVK